MRLRANIERTKKYGQTVAVTLRFPSGQFPFCPEKIIARNIGPRPWSEASFTANDGRKVRIYAK
jgi:hypothetical protein